MELTTAHVCPHVSVANAVKFYLITHEYIDYFIRILLSAEMPRSDTLNSQPTSFVPELNKTHAKSHRSKGKVNTNTVWLLPIPVFIRECIQKFPEWVNNEIYASNNNNKYSLRSNTKGYGDKTHWTDSQNSYATAPNSRELYHLQFSLQVASPETFGYTLVYTVA
jgi:hypothetical protein